VEAVATATAIVVLEARTAALVAVLAAKAASRVVVAALAARTQGPVAFRAGKAVYLAWVAVSATASRSGCSVLRPR
jgi:hypothetical protein